MDNENKEKSRMELKNLTGRSARVGAPQPSFSTPRQLYVPYGNLSQATRILVTLLLGVAEKEKGLS